MKMDKKAEITQMPTVMNPTDAKNGSACGDQQEIYSVLDKQGSFQLQSTTSRNQGGTPTLPKDNVRNLRGD